MEISNEIGESVQSVAASNGWTLDTLDEDELAELEREYAALECIDAGTVSGITATTAQSVPLQGVAVAVDTDTLSVKFEGLRLPDAPITNTTVTSAGSSFTGESEKSTHTEAIEATMMM